MSKNESLAEKMARLRDAEPQSNDLALLFASIEKLNHRLAKVEASLDPSSPIPSPLPHASIDKFDVAEAVSDEIFAGLQKEKACTFEPNGKPCDHCAMCSSRGF
ncbi:MAG: hypothetical protein ABI646_00610 [Acidobacteriota bacterium]